MAEKDSNIVENGLTWFTSGSWLRSLSEETCMSQVGQDLQIGGDHTTPSPGGFLAKESRVYE